MSPPAERPRRHPRAVAGPAVALALVAVAALAWPLLATGAPGTAAPRNGGKSAREPLPAYAPGEVLVRFRAGTPAAERARAHAATGARAKRRFPRLPGLEQVTLPEGASIEAVIAAYRRRPDVLYAEPNHLVRSLAVPDDPRFGELWGLRNTGQTGGTPDADIDAVTAWDRAKGSGSVVVAVIDSGMSASHEDLAGNLWVNPGEVAGNGVDDDGNGWVDDVSGIDLVQDDVTPTDERLLFGHGTHVAGTVGAVGDNAVGVVGVNHDVSIMPIRVLNALDVGTYADIAAAIGYADAHGARVVNISLGGGAFNQTLHDAIAASPGLVVCAAGNDSRDSDVTPTYPASYDLPNILSVGASTHHDARASFSNWGAGSVDVFAPGDDILSTAPRWDRVFRDQMHDLGNWDTSRFLRQPWAANGTRFVSPATAAANPNYPINDMTWMVTTGTVDLSGYTRAALRFDYWLDVELMYDSLLVLVSEDATFTSDERVARLTGRFRTWYSRLVDLKRWAGKRVHVAFALASDSSITYEGVWVDDVEVWGGNDDPRYALADGTSMAAPHAAGLAALLLAEKPSLTTAELKALVMSTAEPTPALSGLCVTGARIDAGAARAALGDLDPPVTTAFGVPAGWAAGDVEISLSATDTESGVAQTWYTLGGGSPQAYAGTFTVSAEGTTPVGYWSIDASGNVEPTRTADVRIDRTPPVTASDAQATYEGTATITLLATDALSGVALTEHRLDGGAWTAGSVVTVGEGGDHDLEYRSTDAAGNVEGTRAAAFHVVAPYVDAVPAGTDVTVVSDSGVTLTFSHVSADGTVTITRLPDPDRRLPASWFFVPGAAYEIEPEVAFTGEVTVTVPYTEPSAYGGAERHLKLLHRNDWGWDDVTVSIDTAGDTVTGRTSDFSPFAVGYTPWEPGSPSNSGSPATPHKGYATNTNKCAVCHAVHAAEPTGTVLLPATAGDACVYCHVDTALGLRRIYGGLRAAYLADSPRGAFGGGFAHDAGGTACADCHSVHGAGTLDGGNLTKILKDWAVWRSAPGAMDDYSTFALARWPSPDTEPGKYSQQTAWCTGCHKYFVESYETTVQMTAGGMWVYAKSHVMTSAPGVYSNPAASVSATVAWAPSVHCRSCHDAGAVDTTGGIVPSSFPHYTPSAYRFATVADSAASASGQNATGTVDGLCLRCHRDGSGDGVGSGF